MNIIKTDTYGFYIIDLHSKKLEILTINLAELNNKLDNFIDDYYKKIKTNKLLMKNILIFKTNTLLPNLNLTDIELIKLLSLCIEITINGIHIVIRGDYDLAKKTIYKNNIIKELVCYNKFIKNVSINNKKELIKYIKDNNIKIDTKLKPKFLIYKKLLKYEKVNIINKIKNKIKK